jgi:membrane protease YdiL (CAAX protease family)
MAILWFIIVPLLKLPNGERSLKKFFVCIKLNKLKPAGKTIGLGVLTSVIILGFSVFSCWIETKITGGTQLFIAESLIRQDTTPNVYYALDPGIWEEIAFRGVIFALLAKLYSERKTIIINGVMFGLFHLINLLNLISLSEDPELMLDRLYNILFQVIYATAMGLFFAYMYSKTKSLIPVIICHYLIDAFITFLTLVILSELIIHLALMTVLGLGLVPAAICIVVVKLVDKRWPEKEEKERVVELTP